MYNKAERTEHEELVHWAKIFGAVAAGMVSLFLVLACTVIVPPQTVGVPVSFGKPQAPMSNGLHVKAPWVKVEKLPATVQNDRYEGDQAITVRLGNNARAGVNATIQWRMKAENASQLYLDYREFDSIRDNLVNRNFVAVTNEVFATYDPLKSVEASKDNESGEDLDAFAQQIRQVMNDRIGDSIDVMSVTVPLIDFDDATQQRIDELQSEIARTRIAQQKQQTSKAEAAANKQLQESISPEVLTSKCLDIVEQNKLSPLGCFPGAAGQPVVK